MEPLFFHKKIMFSITMNCWYNFTQGTVNGES